MYKNIIFDLYGTLIDIHTDEEKPILWEKLALLYGYKGAVYTPEDIKKDYFRYVEEEKEEVHSKYPYYYKIDIQIGNVFRKLFYTKGVNPTDRDIEEIGTFFRSISTDNISIYNGVTDLLKTLKENDRKLYLLSNAQYLFTINELKLFDIYKYFDGIFISSEYLVSKPDIHFFNILAEKSGINKSETIMIGNEYKSDIKGAYGAGIDSLYIRKDEGEEIDGELKAKWVVDDGDIWKIGEYII